MTKSPRIQNNLLHTAEFRGAVASPRPARAHASLWVWVLLVALPILAIPFENEYALFGLGIAKLSVLPLALGILLFYPAQLLKSLNQPIIVTGMLFVGWGAIAEAFHPSSDWDFIFRVFQMLMFAALVSTAVRNPEVLSRVLVAVIGVCVLLSAYLISNFYGLVNIGGDDFKSASNIRYQAFAEMTLQANLNILGYTVAMGAVIAVARLIKTRRALSRIGWGVILITCAIGCMVTVSRGAFLAFASSTGIVVWRGIWRSKRVAPILGVVAVAVTLFVFIPESLTSRLFSSGRQSDVALEKQEARVRVYTAALESFPKYWIFGVGTGEYFNGGWAMENGFGGLGPHNGLLAAWIFFGLPGAVFLCALCALAAHKYSRSYNNWWGGDALFGLMTLGVFWLMFTHNLYLKQFGLILGLLLCADARRAIKGRVPGPLTQVCGSGRQSASPTLARIQGV